MKKIVLGILAHVDSGKTTLAEAMLYRCKSIKKLGRVDKGDSFLDTFSLERSRGITIFSKQAVFNRNGAEFTLLDTPGHTDFSAETERTLQVLDYAVLVISATHGVQSHTVTLWRLLAKYNIPCFIFVNKMDLDGADKTSLLAHLKEKLSDGCVDFSDCESVDFYEELAVCDEKLMNLYYAHDKIEKPDISKAIKRRAVFPCMFGSALKLDGIDAFLDTVAEYTQMPEYGKAFAARVFKISEDKGQRLTHIKITGGNIRIRDKLSSEKNKSGEKINQIRLYSGEKFTALEEAAAGTVCAVTGITFAAAGDGLGAEASAAPPLLQPVFTYGLRLPAGIDAHTALEKMRILEAEDPQLKVDWNRRYNEIQVQLMGDIQLEILRDVIEQRFGFRVAFSNGRIIYKETIKNTVEGVGHFEPLRHYAEVHLILKPGKRGSSVVFKNACKEDILNKNWQRLIMTHLYEKTHIGVLTGSPITDIEITLASGRAHEKHTEGGDFRQATYRAVRQGLRSAESVLLEPVYDFTLELPRENAGRAMHDIQHMHGTFSAPETAGGTIVIKGSAPVSTMHGYVREVMQYTHGNGRLQCAFKGYAPCHNADEVIEEIGYDCDADTENPCDSVFCRQGAGYTVKWNEVASHMHLPSALAKPKSEYAEAAAKKLDAARGSKDLFALDKELMQIFEQTYGPVKSRANDTSRKHFTFTESTETKKYKSKNAPRYDGTEYLLVDGYNVIFSWDRLKALAKDNIDGARNTLINILCNYRGYKKCRLILVFDAYKVKGAVREVEKENGITIVYTKEAETADMYIEKASYKLAKSNRVRVVTSDALEQLIILGNGALRVSSREFEFEVAQAEEEIRNIINKN